MKKRPRGTGFLYKQEGSELIWMGFSVNGIKHREPAGTTDERKATAKLNRRILECKNNPERASDRRITIGDLVADYIAQMRRDNMDTVGKVEERWRVHLAPVFEAQPAALLTTDHVNQYIAARQTGKKKASNATINRELAVLKRAYTIAMNECYPPKVNKIPYMPRLQENNIRRGYVQPEQHEKLLEQAAEIGTYMVGLYQTGYTFGFRSEEVVTLLVRQVDTVNLCIHLEKTKNGEARTAYMTTDLYEALKPLLKGKNPNDPIFTRDDGSPVEDFRKSWYKLCVCAGMGEMHCRLCGKLLDSVSWCGECYNSNVKYSGLLYHDLRRTAIRNMRRRGISEKIAMLISGHKTRSVFDRYDITDESDLREAAQLMDKAEKIERAKVASQTVIVRS